MLFRDAQMAKPQRSKEIIFREAGVGRKGVIASRYPGQMSAYWRYFLTVIRRRIPTSY